MNTIQYNLQFQKLSNVLNLGELIAVPKALSGGLLHRMHSIETTVGKYAIKALNPQIMRRPTAMKHTINGEEIAHIASKSIPTFSAEKFNGTFIQEIENQFYLVFNWIDGRSLKSNEINIEHCEKMGDILVNIHMIDFSKLGIVNESSYNEDPIDWNFYFQKGQQNNAAWVNLMAEMIHNLYHYNMEANKSAKVLSSNEVISHRDLDAKNVMWNQNNPIIIDWESAGYINPMQDLVETAIYWSEDETGSIDKERFLAFITGYKKRYGALEANWKPVLETGFLSKLGWLEYSLKRSLWIECSDEVEQKMGTDQVTQTINSIARYADMILELERWLNNEV